MNIKNKFKYTIAGSIIIITGIIILVIIPMTKRIMKISNDITDLKTNLEKEYNEKQNLKTVMARIKKLEASSEKFSSIYVKEGEELNFITLLEDLAERHDLQQKINLSSTTTGMERDMNIKLTGNYFDILKYLYDLRRMDYWINLNSISINKTDSKIPLQPEEPLNSNMPLEANIAATFYVFTLE